MCDGIEGVGLDHPGQLLVERRAASGRAKGSVAGVAPGAAGDLAEFGGVEPAELVAVEFPVGGEGDVIDIEVEAHADGVGGDDIVDLAVLVEIDLGVAGARAQGAQNHRRAALRAPQPFGDGVNILGAKGDDGAAPGQPRDFPVAGEQELGKTRARLDAHARQQLFQHRLHGPRADEQRLLGPAPVENAVGEDMAAIEGGGELDFVDGDERQTEVARHGLDGRDPVARMARLDLFLAGDQGDGLRPGLGDDAIIDLAREQAQRQADHAGAMAEHPLDGEVGLAGVGRAKNRRRHREEARFNGEPPSARSPTRSEDQGAHASRGARKQATMPLPFWMNRSGVECKG